MVYVLLCITMYIFTNMFLSSEEDASELKKYMKKHWNRDHHRTINPQMFTCILLHQKIIILEFEE